MFCIFEDSDAVIKMIIKGRSPTMRLIQNPQSCHWQNQSRYKDINQICRHQTPTRRHIYEGQLHAWWVEQSCPFVQQRRFQLNLLFSEFQLYQLPWNDGEKDSRRERRREDCGNVKADVKKLVSHAATSSSTVQSPIASKSPVTRRAPCHPDWKRTGKLVAREHNQVAASCSQVWQKDAEMDKSTRRLAASGISDIDGKGTPWPQSAYIYRLRFTSWESCLECATEIRSQTGRHNGRSRFCGECSCPLLFKLTVHLVNDCAENFHSIKKQPKRTLKQLFNVTEKLIRYQKEISGIPVICWQQLMW